MANEHTLVIQKTSPVSYTVANGTGIEKGAVLKMTSPRTAALADGANDILAGISATEKIASDGRVTLGVIEGPGDQFVATASGTITVGDPIAVSATTNMVSSVKGDDLSGLQRLGFALQSVTTGQTVRYRLDMGVSQ